MIGIEEDLPTRIKDFDLNGVHVIFLHGRMNYSKDLPIIVEKFEEYYSKTRKKQCIVINLS